MKTVFYGAAIQGASNRGERAGLNRELIDFIKSRGFRVISEHTGGANSAETARLLEQSFGTLPADPISRSRFIRRKLIHAIEDPRTHCCVFEVSIPSTGTGNEIAHAYIRPRLGLPVIPVLALYQTGSWQNGLSTMIRGIDTEEISHFVLEEYGDITEAKAHISDILRKL